MIDLPRTNTTAEITFQNPDQANLFAMAWSRKTLMGHTVGGNIVKVYNVTDETRRWIDSYISELNNANK